MADQKLSELTSQTYTESAQATNGLGGVAISDSPTVALGVDFLFDNDGEAVTLVQVVDDDDDITKAITV